MEKQFCKCSGLCRQVAGLAAGVSCKLDAQLAPYDKAYAERMRPVAFPTDLTVETMADTNRRLHRRCQKLEHDLLVLERSLPHAVAEMHKETFRINRASANIRDIFIRKKKLERYWDRCWSCRFRRWFRSKLWNRFFASP